MFAPSWWAISAKRCKRQDVDSGWRRNCFGAEIAQFLRQTISDAAHECPKGRGSRPALNTFPREERAKGAKCFVCSREISCKVFHCFPCPCLFIVPRRRPAVSAGPASALVKCRPSPARAATGRTALRLPPRPTPMMAEEVRGRRGRAP